MLGGASGIHRSFGFAAGALLLLFGLVQVLKSLPAPYDDGSRAFGNSRGPGAYSGSSAKVRIKKVSALIGEPNHLYEAALQTHEKHNKLHGYEMGVLRERIEGNFRAKPSYLFSLMVSELAKPVDKRIDWLVWVDPDTVVLNPQIPLEMFLPPDDEKDIHFIATHDTTGINSGVMFMRVHQWSLKMLIQVLTVSLAGNEHELAVSKDQPALEQVLGMPDFGGKTVFQPRPWFNAFHIDGKFEGQLGAMFVHFPDITANKWVAMDMYIRNVSQPLNPWEVKVKDTPYEPMMGDYWGRIKQARKLLEEAEERETNEVQLHEACEYLRHALDHDTDRVEIMIDALLSTKLVMKEKQHE